MKPKAISPELLSQILSPKFQIRFWKKVERRGTHQCWPWKASLSNGYGQIGVWDTVKNHMKKAHKFAWISTHNRDVPLGLFVLHSCGGKRSCCNPAHLKLGSHQDNMDDMVEQGRCGLTGVFGESHPTSKLTAAKVLKIRAMYKRKIVTGKILSKQFNTTVANIYSVVARKSWTHI